MRARTCNKSQSGRPSFEATYIGDAVNTCPGIEMRMRMEARNGTGIETGTEIDFKIEFKIEFAIE
jgi:hypothetical protein